VHGDGGKHGAVEVGGTAKHCVDKYTVLFRYCSLGGDTDMPVGLHAIGFAMHFSF